VTKPLELTAWGGDGDEERPLGVDGRLEVEEVYRRHAQDVVRWASRLSGRPSDAWDITHEVFAVVHRRLGDFSAREGTLSTWLFRITANVVRSQRRRERLRSWFFVGGEDGASEEVAAGAPDPETQALARDDARRVYRVLNTLGEVDRSLIILFELEGYSGERVAELLGLKGATIWVRLHRARQRFLMKLQDLEPEVVS
jgi:RNA polymerase sigma-70 factor (ECF subfamily)